LILTKKKEHPNKPEMPEHSRRGVSRRVAQAAFFCSFLSLHVPAAGFVTPNSFKPLAQNSVLHRSRGQRMMVATHMSQRDDTQSSRRGFVVGSLLGHAVLASNPLLVHAKEADQEKKLKLVKSGSRVDVKLGGFTWRILS